MAKKANLPPATAAQKLKYVNVVGVRCLFCDSADLDAGRCSTDDDGIRRTVTCESCGRKWVDVYVLKSVEPYEDE